MYHQATFSEFGQPEKVLSVSSAPPCNLEQGSVRLRVVAAPINPADINLVQGVYGIKPDLPAVAGVEGCGRVVESRSDELSEGDLVIFVDHIGTWSEEVVCPASAVLKIPSETPFEQAAMLKVNPLTALCMLTELTDLQEGDWVLQNAANSGVGACVIQIAKLLGLRTINLVRREELLSGLKKLGGNINLLDEVDSVEQIQELKPALALNAVGGDSALRLMDALHVGGLHVTYGAMSRRSLKIPNKFLIFKGVRLHGFWMTEWLKQQTPERIANAYHQLAEWMVLGDLTQPVDSTFSLKDIQAAVTRAQEDMRSGKVIISMSG